MPKSPHNYPSSRRIPLQPPLRVILLYLQPPTIILFPERGRPRSNRRRAGRRRRSHSRLREEGWCSDTRGILYPSLVDNNRGGRPPLEPCQALREAVPAGQSLHRTADDKNYNVHFLFLKIFCQLLGVISSQSGCLLAGCSTQLEAHTPGYASKPRPPAGSSRRHWAGEEEEEEELPPLSKLSG